MSTPPDVFLGRRPLHSETIAYRDEVQKLIDADRKADRDFQIEVMKVLLQAIITGKVRG